MRKFLNYVLRQQKKKITTIEIMKYKKYAWRNQKELP